MPSQSVLPPISVSPSYQTVLTAPIASAARSRRSTRRNAASLCGMVMLPPAKPLRFEPAEERFEILRRARRRTRRRRRSRACAASSRAASASANARPDDP